MNTNSPATALSEALDAMATILTPIRSGDDPAEIFGKVAQTTSWLAAAKTHLPELLEGANFQSRVDPWLLACFGEEIARDKEERNHRFLEEALELVQSCGCTASEAHQLVDYVFGRPVGEKAQEAGGVMVTLAALCLANALDMHDAGETELARIWTKVEKIRAKQAAKPKHSPLPEASDSRYPAQLADAKARTEGRNLDGSERRETVAIPDDIEDAGRDLWSTVGDFLANNNRITIAERENLERRRDAFRDAVNARAASASNEEAGR